MKKENVRLFLRQKMFKDIVKIIWWSFDERGNKRVKRKLKALGLEADDEVVMYEYRLGKADILYR